MNDESGIDQSGVEASVTGDASQRAALKPYCKPSLQELGVVETAFNFAGGPNPDGLYST